jgi:DNA polymerase-1
VVTVDEPGPGAARPAARRQVVAEDGTPAGPPGPFDPVDGGEARWVWPDTAEAYPGLLRAGTRVERCHDLALTEALLSGYDGRWGEPRGLAAAWARLRGLPVPDDPPHRSEAGQAPAEQLALFETEHGPALPGAGSELEAAVAVHAEQLRRIAAVGGRFRLLVAAESAGALAAAEIGAAGLPWRADVHDALLTELLGPRPVGGTGRPKRLAELADRIAAAFGAAATGPPGHAGETSAGRRGGYRINPDSPAEVVRAFARVGITVPSTRAFVLREIDHPAVEPLLRYKELSRLHTANGWAFLSSWVRDGRFRAEYVAGGVVSGRWATRGGGALQIPKQLRRAVVADPGHLLVVADAGQLEPRVLAAMAEDHRMAAAAGSTDLYAALAADAFDGDRAKAKIAVLSAMYGGTSGPGGVLLGTLKRRFPAAVEFVEAAARTGERGGLVRSHLGRTCPPPSAGWLGETRGGASGEPGAPDWAGEPGAPVAGASPTGEGGGEAVAGAAAERGGGRTDAAARARGRFTRNFVVQATASEWALILLAELRGKLAGLPGAELVFFQHDEVIVHCPEELAPAVMEAVTECAERAGRMLFGDTEVRFPLDLSAVRCYADAK